MKTIENLQSINTDSVSKMEETVDEIDKLIDDPNLSLADESRLISRRATLTAQINNQMIVQAHLKASKVIVNFTPQEESDLDALNDEMDTLIVKGLKVDAMLSLVPKVIDTALAIGNTITTHTGV